MLLQHHQETPTVWTVFYETTDGRSRTWAFDTFAEAEKLAHLLRLELDCHLVSVNYGPDWSRVTLFLYFPLEVPRDKPIQESGDPG